MKTSETHPTKRNISFSHKLLRPPAVSTYFHLCFLNFHLLTVYYYFNLLSILLRIFDKENQCFIDNVTDIFFPDSEFNVIQISDHLKNQLKEIPKTELSIEYEFLIILF